MNTPDPRQAPQRLLAGAVDLSSLAQSRSAPAGDAPQPGAPVDKAAVIDVTEETFQAEVLERSMSVPVVIDFWADWCEPCKQLSPVLEKLAGEGDGTWTLAKIDVEANAQLQAAFGVQSIPTVIAVWQGRPVDGFQGVQPESTLRQWIGRLMEAVGGEAPEAPEASEETADPGLQAAESALENGDLDGAQRAYEAYLNDNPGSTEAEAGLAQVGLVRRITDVDLDAAIATADADKTDIGAALLAADAEVITGNAEAGYDRLITLVGRTAGDDRDRVRKHLLELFAIAPSDDPTVLTARRKLATVLF